MWNLFVRPVHAWVAIGLMSAWSGCGAAYRHPRECEMFPSLPAASTVPAPALDLTAARAYYNYIAVTDVQPAGHHFALWYRDVEPQVQYLRAERDAAGHLRLGPEGGYWGGYAIPVGQIPAVAPEHRALVNEVLTTVRGRCPDVRDFQIQDLGAGRRVTVREVVLHQLRREGRPRVGWHATLTLLMDADLTRIESTLEEQSGFSVFEVKADAQWIVLPPSSQRRMQLASVMSARADAITQAAQRFVTRQPPRALDSLYPADAPNLPPDLVAPVVVTVALYGNRPPNSRAAGPVFQVPLDLHDAVFGQAANGEMTVSFGSGRYVLRARLEPAEVRQPQTAPVSFEYRSTLTLQLDDERGRTWSQQYVASGMLEAEGEVVFAPYGLTIPGASAPSPEADALRGRLLDQAPYDTVDLVVDPQLSFDPRNDPQ